MQATTVTEGRLYAADTSFAVASLDPSHTAHARCSSLARAHRPALAGHAAFETHAVLTRLPGAQRIEPQVAAALVTAAYPQRCWLSPDEQHDLLARLGDLDIAGGQVYDALVAQAAHLSSRILLTRDNRATRTYDKIGVDFEVVD